MRGFRACVSSICVLFSAAAFAHEPQPKYGPEATPLSLSHEYFREARAPDFWALIPYYAAQQDESSCSVASVSMAVNGARVGQRLTADDPLVTQAELVKRVTNAAWHRGRLSLGGLAVTLDQLGEIAREAFRIYGLKPTVEVVHVNAADASARARLHATLVQNEKSARDFILANFDQKAYTGDADVGHIAPVGAYDAKRRRVLILDPDRRWYEPYWVSEQTFLKGMSTLDRESGKNRGYVWIKF